MAYGLDVEEVYCTDENLVDIGVVDTYHIQFDTANEKDFELQTNELYMPVHGIWYIPNTEYGGYVDGYESDSDEMTVMYKGRTWRGLLASHFVDFGVNKKRSFTTGLGQPQFDYDGTPANNITDVINDLLEEAGEDWFVCDEPLVDESIDTEITTTEVEEGITVYDCIIEIGDSNNFSFLFEYNPKDKKIHLIPILQQDYTDYMQYSNIASLGFQIEINEKAINHVIAISEEETGERRVLHIFADDSGIIQPVASVDNPIKDSQYYLDKRSQVLFGVDEVADRLEANVNVIENYELITVAPKDWRTKFGSYFYKKEDVDEETGEVSESYEMYAAEEFEPVPSYSLLTSKPSDWNSNYSQYYTRTYNPDYTSIDTYIVGNEPYESDWLSKTAGGNPLNPVEGQLYRIAQTSGDFKVDTYYQWNEDKRVYYKTAGDRYQYSNVSGVTSYTMIKKVTKKPADWKYHYSDYYYYFQTGTGRELRQYDGVQKSKYVLMTKKPSDWNTNFGSYFRKVYKKVTYEQHKLKSGRLSKKKKVIKYIDCVNHEGAIYINCKEDDDKKGGKIPSFSKRKHYRNDGKVDPPQFNSKNTYRARTKTTAPSFASDMYYKMTEVPQRRIPNFDPTNTYRQVLDHYAEMVQNGIQIIEQSQKVSIQKMFLDDFDVNIGDTVGGRDEMTGTTIIGHVTNVTAKIENGLLDAEYEVVVDMYDKGE